MNARPRGARVSAKRLLHGVAAAPLDLTPQRDPQRILAEAGVFGEQFEPGLLGREENAVHGGAG